MYSDTPLTNNCAGWAANHIGTQHNCLTSLEITVKCLLALNRLVVQREQIRMCKNVNLDTEQTLKLTRILGMYTNLNQSVCVVLSQTL